MSKTKAIAQLLILPMYSLSPLLRGRKHKNAFSLYWFGKSEIERRVCDAGFVVTPPASSSCVSNYVTINIPYSSVYMSLPLADPGHKETIYPDQNA